MSETVLVNRETDETTESTEQEDMSPKRELSSVDKLVETEAQTNDDGSVNVTIDGWEELEGGDVRVDFVTPIGNVESEVMDFPQPGGDLREYKFYRILQETSVDMRNADLLDGEQVRARVDDSFWYIDVEKQPTNKEKAAEALELLKSIKWKDILASAVWLVLASVLIISILGLVFL